jgi:1-acyl-sn-glycerol-3-phosphate acyltransferase
VIVANHQSFADILSILALHPKIVMLVNSWVWKSPFFGILVRNLGFYHVENGFENSVGALRSMVADGYSIAVFPEGTRSPDTQMRRFHNGAFYLAKQLDMDVIPVVLYGTGMVMPKNDAFNVRRGIIAIETLPRIDRQLLRANADRQNAHNTATLMKRHYDGMKERYNTTDNPYFRQRLITSFIYKGPVTEWYLRIKLRMERNYQMFDGLIPRRAAITDIGCGYGFMAYMLAALSDGRVITGIDYDRDKIETANHCFSKTDRLQFIAADAVNYPLPPSDVFIISDMLHYLLPEAQHNLLHQCVEKLLPNGIIIIRDGDSNMQKAHRLTRLTEFFSTRLLKFNKTANELHFLSDDSLVEFSEKHGLKVEKMNNDGYTSNKVYVFCSSTQMAQI